MFEERNEYIFLKAQQIPSKINSKISILRHFLIKLLKDKDKERIPKASIEIIPCNIQGIINNIKQKP